MLDLNELEELSKAVHPKAIKAFLRNAATMRDQKATPEERALAEANVKAIVASGKTPKSQKKAQSSIDLTPSKNLDPLKQELEGAKDKVSAINNKKIQENLSNKSNADKNLKAEQAAAREAARQAERQKNLLPGSNYTREELEAHAARQSRDPNAVKEKELAPVSPMKAAMASKTSHDATVKKALDLAHQLHAGGETDHAHTILSKIPRESMPPELKHYDPMFIHYGVSPHAWTALPPEHQEHIKNFHHEVSSGMHNNSPHEGTKAIVGKVQGLLKPQKS